MVLTERVLSVLFVAVIPPRRCIQTEPDGARAMSVEEEERWRPHLSPCLARAVHRAPVLAAVAVHWLPGPRAEAAPEVPA